MIHSVDQLIKFIDPGVSIRKSFLLKESSRFFVFSM